VGRIVAFFVRMRALAREQAATRAALEAEFREAAEAYDVAEARAPPAAPRSPARLPRAAVSDKKQCNLQCATLHGPLVQNAQPLSFSLS